MTLSESHACCGLEEAPQHVGLSFRGFKAEIGHPYSGQTVVSTFLVPTSIDPGGTPRTCRGGGTVTCYLSDVSMNPSQHLVGILGAPKLPTGAAAPTGRGSLPEVQRLGIRYQDGSVVRRSIP